ncbi:hypothetical protein B0H63DRAFT_92157, partial [Podospora didyma]
AVQIEPYITNAPGLCDFEAASPYHAATPLFPFSPFSRLEQQALDLVGESMSSIVEAIKKRTKGEERTPSRRFGDLGGGEGHGSQNGGHMRRRRPSTTNSTTAEHSRASGNSYLSRVPKRRSSGISKPHLSRQPKHVKFVVDPNDDDDDDDDDGAYFDRGRQPTPDLDGQDVQPVPSPKALNDIVRKLAEDTAWLKAQLESYSEQDLAPNDYTQVLNDQKQEISTLWEGLGNIQKRLEGSSEAHAGCDRELKRLEQRLDERYEQLRNPQETDVTELQQLVQQIASRVSRLESKGLLSETELSEVKTRQDGCMAKIEASSEKHTAQLERMLGEFDKKLQAITAASEAKHNEIAAWADNKFRQQQADILHIEEKLQALAEAFETRDEEMQALAAATKTATVKSMAKQKDLLAQFDERMQALVAASDAESARLQESTSREIECRATAMEDNFGRLYVDLKKEAEIKQQEEVDKKLNAMYNHIIAWVNSRYTEAGSQSRQQGLQTLEKHCTASFKQQRGDIQDLRNRNEAIVVNAAQLAGGIRNVEYSVQRVKYDLQRVERLLRNIYKIS